jgi:manganese/zinc/iron transport system permease protein
MIETFLQVDLAAIFGALLAALACALVGNFLIATRQAMLADAMSHAVLPGVLVAFLITGGVAAGPMFAGAVAAGLATAGLVAFLARVGVVEPGVAIGAAFTTLFAVGVVALEASGAARAAFDVHHVLLGNLEGLIWPTATGLDSLFDPARLAELPPALGRMVLVLAAVALALGVLRRPLALLAFDADFAAASGVAVRALSFVLLALTALATVAAFESVGVVLALAMIVCPPLTARLLARTFRGQVVGSLVVAAVTVLAGYGAAVLLPPLLGFDAAVSASGSIGVVSGLFLAAALALSRDQQRPAPRTAKNTA